ncbi:MAG: hypothetical protein GF331_05405 [Chitinivibrionales bacterium]|nr:hypothetical protein [Chitinivibrionales bacterium]
MQILAILCYAFAIADFGLYLFGYDITGVSWSPLVAALLGSMFMKLGRKQAAAAQAESAAAKANASQGPPA